MLENQHTIDTANRKSVPVPSVTDKPPKKARRDWALFMADRDWEVGSELYQKAEFVRLSIDALILNLGRDGEGWARRNLSEQETIFLQAWAER